MDTEDLKTEWAHVGSTTLVTQPCQIGFIGEAEVKNVGKGKRLDNNGRRWNDRPWCPR